MLRVSSRRLRAPTAIYHAVLDVSAVALDAAGSGLYVLGEDFVGGRVTS